MVADSCAYATMSDNRNLPEIPSYTNSTAAGGLLDRGGVIKVAAPISDGRVPVLLFSGQLFPGSSSAQPNAESKKCSGSRQSKASF